MSSFSMSEVSEYPALFVGPRLTENSPTTVLEILGFIVVRGNGFLFPHRIKSYWLGDVPLVGRVELLPRDELEEKFAEYVPYEGKA